MIPLPSDKKNLEEEKIKKNILRKVLTPKARERLGRLKLVKPDLVARIEMYLINLYNQGKIQQPITDEKLKKILMLIGK